MGKFLCIILLLVNIADFASAFTGQEHSSEQLTQIWGFKRETLLEVNRLIDTVPEQNITGGFNHRLNWGHSDIWFNNNWETIAALFKAECPELTRKELKALAQKVWDIHMNGDMTTSAGVTAINNNALKARLKNYPLEIAQACNKAALSKTIRNQNIVQEFISQPANIERIQAENLININRTYNIQVLGRNNIEIITQDGKEYIIAVGKSINDLRQTMQRFPDKNFAVTSEDFARLSERDSKLAQRVITFRELGDKRTGEKIIKDAMNLCENLRENIIKHDEANIKSVKNAVNKSLNKSALKNIAPYALFGAFKAISENWEFITDAYNNNSEWSKALTRTGIDFAGYTVTPMLIDGVFAAAGEKIALMTSLKSAGMGYTLGYFIWNAGKEFFSYQTGDISADISQEGFYNRIKENITHEIELLPVNVLAYVISGTGYTIFVPVVIIAGSFAIQRIHSWHENKIWRNTVYIEDVRAILGDDLINAFTLINSEEGYNIANPERRSNIAEPERRRNFLQP